MNKAHAFKKNVKPDRVSTTSNASFISQNYTPVVVSGSQTLSQNVSIIEDRTLQTISGQEIVPLQNSPTKLNKM